MKRHMVLLLLFSLLLVPVSANSAIGMILETGLDAATKTYSHPVIVDGETVHLGGRSHKELKQTFQAYDFSTLAFDERLDLYQSTQLSVTWPAFKNLLAGFGSGSKLQGHLSGELFGIVSDWTTISIVGVGLGIMATEYFVTYLFSYNTADPSYSPSELPIAVMIVGGGAFALGRIIQAIIPISYGLRYNRTLRGGLGVEKDMTDSWSVGLAMQPAMQEGLSSLSAVQLTAMATVALR